MTDETPKKRTRRPRAASPAGVPPADVGGVEDPDDALRRLESMGSAKGPGDPVEAASLPPAPVVDSFSAPPTNRPQRPMGSSQRAPRSRTRPAAGPSSTRMVARIAFPVVFLVAVIALIGIVVQSGVMSSDQPAATPSAKATKAGGSTSVTKKYVVQTGDSLSTIAARFNTTTSELLVLNPDLSGSSTVVVGQRIIVPRP